MSETIWKAEAEAGLVAFIRQYMKLDGRPVKASVRLPDEGLKDEQFPCITVFNLFDVPNENRRQHSRFQPRLVGRDNDRGVALLTRQPIPIDAHYQFDFWSKSNRQINEMTRKWMDKCEGYFNLDCRDVSDNLRSIFCRQAGRLRPGLQGHDQARRVRVFNASIDYRIWLEIYEKDVYTVRTVAEGGVVFRLRADRREEAVDGNDKNKERAQQTQGFFSG